MPEKYAPTIPLIARVILKHQARIHPSRFNRNSRVQARFIRDEIGIIANASLLENSPLRDTLLDIYRATLTLPRLRDMLVMLSDSQLNSSFSEYLKLRYAVSTLIHHQLYQELGKLPTSRISPTAASDHITAAINSINFDPNHKTNTSPAGHALAKVDSATQNIPTIPQSLYAEPYLISRTISQTVSRHYPTHNRHPRNLAVAMSDPISFSADKSPHYPLRPYADCPAHPKTIHMIFWFITGGKNMVDMLRT